MQGTKTLVGRSNNGHYVYYECLFIPDYFHYRRVEDQLGGWSNRGKFRARRRPSGGNLIVTPTGGCFAWSCGNTIETQTADGQKMPALPEQTQGWWAWPKQPE
jgi:hypothetical protein